MIVLGKRSWLSLLFWTKGAPIQRIWPRLLVVVVVAALVTYGHEHYGYFEPGLTTTPFALIGLALGIFLGFRNNTSYDRFWEGRKLWGSLVNTSRSVTRQIQTLISPDDSSDNVHKELTGKVIAYVHSLRHHLRNQHCPGDAQEFLSEDDIKSLKNHINFPIGLLTLLGKRFSEEWRAGRIDSMHLPVLEQSLTTLTNIQGACERIKSTPIPASYTLLIHRLVATYVFALPFGLVSTTTFFTPIVVALIAYAFLGLDGIGDEIEEPFGEDNNDLPLSTLSRMIEINLKQNSGNEDIPKLLVPIKNKLS